MALDYVETSKKIIEGVGGAGNIASATHCMTRLRLVLVDESKANDAKVGKIKGVKSVIKQGGQYQVVIGNEVSNLFKEFKTMGNFGGEGGAAAAKKDEGPVLSRILNFIAGSMTPLLPGMLGCGMVKVILTLLTNFAGLDQSSSTYVIFNALGDCFFLFLPVLLCYTTAKKLDGNPIMWMIIGCMLVYPDLVSLMGGSLVGANGEVIALGALTLGPLNMPTTSLFGIPVICATYTSAVLPILLMAPIMKWVEDFADRVSPNVLKAFLKPLLFCLICSPIVLLVLGPIGNVIGNALSQIFTVMYNTVPWLTVGVLAALMPFIVMTGMHYALLPLFMSNLATLGYDVTVLVTMYCSNLAQGGATLGVALKTKDTETRSEGIACGISALAAGVTEPGMYGINLRYRKPMIAAVIGAAVGGLFCGLTAVRGYSMGGSPSLLSLITFIGGDDPMHGVIFGGIAAVIILGISAGLAFFLFNDSLLDKGSDEEEAEEVPEAPKTALVDKIIVASPLTGTVVPLKDIPDEVFAGGTLGEGVGVIPTVGKVIAPCDGEISSVMDTMHAVGLTTDSGLELLVHVGLNTVELNGKYYNCKVAEGDKVKKGDVLIEFDLDAIKAAGYQMHTPVLVTNSDEYASVLSVASGSVKAGEDLINVG